MRNIKFIILSISICYFSQSIAQSKIIRKSIWADKPMVFYNSKLQTLETDTFMLLPRCMGYWGSCCINLNNKKNLHLGITLEQNSFNTEKENQFIGGFIGFKNQQGTDIRSIYELHYQRSLHEGINNFSMAFHKPILYKNIIASYFVPRIMLGVQAGFASQRQAREIYANPILTYFLPKARAAIYTTLHIPLPAFSHKNEWQLRPSIGLKWVL